MAASDMQQAASVRVAPTGKTDPADAVALLRQRLAADPLVPPAPKPAAGPFPLWKLIPQLRRNALPTWAEPAYEEEVVSRPFLGGSSFLLNSPDAIRRVLVDNTENYQRTPAGIRILGPIIGQGLFLAEGARWRHQRRLTAPAFAPRSLDLVAREAAARTDDLLAKLRPEPRTAVDLLAMMQRLTLEVAGRALFSQAMDRHGPALRAAIDRYGRGLARPYLLDFMLPTSVPSPHDLFRRWFARSWRQLIDAIIAERAKSGPADPPRDLYDVLVAARDGDGAAFTSIELRDQIATLIIAGHETTALTLFWSCNLLALSPDTQDMVAAEAAGPDLGPDNASAALPRLQITRAVIQEALRLYPPAFTIVRMGKGPDRIGGHEVPAGAMIVISPWVLHRHRKLWQHPERFDPTRFLDGAPPIDRFAWLPFGVGPRVCIGAQFALNEATLVLAKLVRAFRLELVDRRPVMPVGVVTVVPERAPAFRLRDR